MQNRQFKRFIYTVRHQYMTMNNVVLMVAAVIAISWSWSSIEAVQRNYQLQREVYDKQQQEQLMQLQTDNLQFQQHYFKSQEYQSLEARRRLGLADPGEKVLILPPNTAAVKAQDAQQQASATNPQITTIAPPPFQQWLDFLLGGNRQNPNAN